MNTWNKNISASEKIHINKNIFRFQKNTRICFEKSQKIINEKAKLLHAKKIHPVEISQHTIPPPSSNLPAFIEKLISYTIAPTDTQTLQTHTHKKPKISNTTLILKEKHFFPEIAQRRNGIPPVLLRARIYRPRALPSADWDVPQTENLRLRCP